MSHYLPSLLLLALCLALAPAPHYLPADPLPAPAEALPAVLLFHFTHANTFHFLANATALIAFKPRPATLAVAYIAATAAGIAYIALPHALQACGLSGIICAAIARKYAAYRASPLTFLLLQAPLALLFSNYSFTIHTIAFITAYIIWKLYYSKMNGQSKTSSPKMSDDVTTCSSKALTSSPEKECQGTRTAYTSRTTP